MDTGDEMTWTQKRVLSKIVRINSAGFGEHLQGAEGEETADRRRSMDPEGCPQGGSTADTLEECGRRKRKYHCTLPGFLFSPGIGDPERNQRDTADPTGPPAPGH